MRVIVVPHDPAWPDAFAAASREVAVAMGENLISVHHIGSTSIPGIWAKPVIDMLPVVRDIGAVDAQAGALRRLGYEVMGEYGIPGRRYFRLDDPAGMRTRNVHVFADGSPHVARHLAFRDFMRAHGELARQYSDLKRRLAELHPNDIEAYMDGKDAFIKEMEARALRWVEARQADGNE
jgi:GrpB-like predicted nucleotidyltransferase (UPF0157 family)